MSIFFFSSRRRHTRLQGDWSSDVCSSDLDLASELVTANVPRITKEQLVRIESATDELNSGLPQLRRFILPGGSVPGAELHVARAVCRRAERRIVALSKIEAINPEVLPYINRLSSMLFVLARTANKLQRVPEEEFVREK